MTKEQFEILEHTVYRAPQGFYCGGGKAMDELVADGLMEYVGRKSFVPDPYYAITRKGRDVFVRFKLCGPNWKSL